MQLTIEEIPENKAPVQNEPIRVVKKNVHFDQSAPPRQPKARLSYEDILANMGMMVADGKLHLADKKTTVAALQQQQQQQPPVQNSYIYNKYFQDHTRATNNQTKRPQTMEEYKQMVLQAYIEKQRVQQMKSRKLLMPTDNIQIANGRPSGDMNKLFRFSFR